MMGKVDNRYRAAAAAVGEGLQISRQGAWRMRQEVRLLQREQQRQLLLCLYFLSLVVTSSLLLLVQHLQ